MAKRSYMISVRMRAPDTGGSTYTHELHMRENSQDLAIFLRELNAMPSVVEFTIYSTTEIPALHRFKMTPFDLGIEGLDKFK